MTYNLLASALHHPDSESPYRGLFNKRSLSSLAKHNESSVTCFAPIPYAPPVGPRSEFWRVPIYESFSSYDVVRPRFPYFLPKSLFYAVTGRMFQRMLRKTTSGTDADILHGCHIYPDGYGLTKIAASRELPLTVTCHGHYLNNFSNLPPGVANQVRKTLSIADHIFCVSHALTQKASEITPHNNISTVPIGANPENFSTKKESQFRDDYNLSSDTTVILFCGQFIPRKGVDDIIDVLPELPSSNIEYIFIGHGGNLENELQKATNSKQSPANTKVYTELDTETLRKWYVIADLLLLPSYAEGRPTVIYEAMAAETAVLSTLIDGVSEQVVPGETGQLIKPGNKNKLIEKIRHMASNKHDLSKMGKNGKERLISNHWTWHDHADKIVNIHSKLLGSVTQSF